MSFFEDVSLPLLDIFNGKLGIYYAPPQGLGLIPTEESVSRLNKLKLQIIYSMANAPSYPPTAKEMAVKFSKSKKHIEKTLSEIYDKVGFGIQQSVQHQLTRFYHCIQYRAFPIFVWPNSRLYAFF